MKKNKKRIATLLLCFLFAFGLFLSQLNGIFVSAEVTVDIDIEKTWVDNDNADGNRPNYVTVYLMNGEDVAGTLILDSEHNWKGSFTDVPRFDDEGNEIHYTLQEVLSDGYLSEVITGAQTDGYVYPANVSTKIIDTSSKTTPAVNVAGSTEWKIQQGLNTDLIRGSQVSVNKPFNINSISFTEYDADGNIVPENERIFVIIKESSQLYVFAKLESGSGKYITADHGIKITIPNGASIQDGTKNGFVTDLELTFDNIKVYANQNLGSTHIVNIQKDQIWVGVNGFYLNASGKKASGNSNPMWVDVTVRIPGITDGEMLFSFTDVDIPQKVGSVVANEAVWLKSGFEKTIYTVPLKTATETNTQTNYLKFSVDDEENMLATSCNGNDVNGTFNSGFVARGIFSEGGITMTSVTGNCATEFFKAVIPVSLMVTVDNQTFGGNGGIASEQHGWMNRNFGETKVITLTPDAYYHIDTITLDGKAVNLNGFDESGVMNLNSGSTERGKNTTETVTLYQRENGIVEIVLPAQYFTVNGVGGTRVDHSIDVTYAPNGIIKSYTLVGTAAVSVTGTKTWVCGDSDHPENNELELKVMQKLQGAADDTAVEYGYNPDTQLSWSENIYTISDLPLYDSEGNTFEYIVKEVPLAGYTTSYDESDPNNIINTINQQNIDVQGKVTWQDDGVYEHDNQNEVTIHLYRKSGKTGAVSEEVVTASIEWTGNNFKFKNLPLFDEEGYAYTYSVAETLNEQTYLPSGDSYRTATDDTGFNFINTLTGVTEVTGTKTWVCGDAEHPENDTLILNLSRKLNGTADETAVEVTISAPVQFSWNGNAYVYSGLEKYDENGVRYVYFVSETAPDGYTVTYDSENPYNIINTVTQQNVTVDGTVTWKDGNSYTHNNDDEFSVVLIRKSNKPGAIAETLDIEATWDGDTYSFENLPKYDDEGYLYNYEVSGSVVTPSYLPNGDSFVTTSDESGRNFVNTLTGTQNVCGVLTWEDGDDIAHDNGAETELVLKRKSTASGAEEESMDKTYTWDDDTYNFGDQPKYDAEGYPYIYTVTENDIPNYTIEYDGWDIKNTYIPQEQTVTVHFIYDDGSKAAEDVIIQVLEFSEYSVNIPEIDGCTADKTVIEGVIMRGTPVEETVVYSRNPLTGNDGMLICSAFFAVFAFGVFMTFGHLKRQEE